MDGQGLGFVIFMVIHLAVIIFMIASVWLTFQKAGKPGWASIVPIYNVVVMCQIAGKPGWWVLLMLIPIVGIIVAIIVTVRFAEAFGKGTGFAVGMIFLGFIFWPILGFGSAQYQGVS